jgi:hypothetical protein
MTRRLYPESHPDCAFCNEYRTRSTIKTREIRKLRKEEGRCFFCTRYAVKGSVCCKRHQVYFRVYEKTRKRRIMATKKKTEMLARALVYGLGSPYIDQLYDCLRGLPIEGTIVASDLAYAIEKTRTVKPATDPEKTSTHFARGASIISAETAIYKCKTVTCQSYEVEFTGLKATSAKCVYCGKAAPLIAVVRSGSRSDIP